MTPDPSEFSIRFGGRPKPNSSPKKRRKKGSSKNGERARSTSLLA
jgi:hypothetical protein